MTDIENKVDRWDHDDLQQQVWELENIIREQQKTIEDLQLSIAILSNDLNTIKMEGCWKFIEHPTHTHTGDKNEN